MKGRKTVDENIEYEEITIKIPINTKALSIVSIYEPLCSLGMNLNTTIYDTDDVQELLRKEVK